MDVIDTDKNLNKLFYDFIEFVDNKNFCDSSIFHELSKVADAIVATFGKCCEVLIHDLSSPESSVIYIAGNVTNRKIGAPVTNFVLEKLRKHDHSCENSICYKNVTKDGKTLKSSTIFIRNSKNKIIAALCINYDITKLISYLEQITAFDNSKKQEENSEFFSNDINEILATIINQTIRTKGLSIKDINKEDKIEIVGILDIKGVFLIKGAVDKVALALGVSRYTIYNYLEQNRTQRNTTFESK